MALTQEQWYLKLRAWVPSWWFEQEHYNVAVFKAIAKVMSQVEADMEAHQVETFIAQAEAQFLDAHGDERRIARRPGESDAEYATRVRILVNTSIVANLKGIVDGILANGECQLIENFYYGYFGDDLFFEEDSTVWLDGTKSMNWITFITPVQLSGVAATIQAAIIAAINEAKALGVAYDVLYK